MNEQVIWKAKLPQMHDTVFHWSPLDFMIKS